MRNFFFAFVVLFCSAFSCLASQPRVIAHRGYWKTEGSAQNSIRALIKADSIGCYGSEFDVWLTADDVLVVNHNADINGKIIETGISEDLLVEKLPNGEFMPSLEAFLDSAKVLSVELVLEVKPHKDKAREAKAVPMIIDMVQEKGLTERVTYITFSREAHDLLVQLCGRPVYYLTSVTPEELQEMKSTGPDFNINALRKHPDWIPAFKLIGMPINIWTIANDTDLQYCIEQEADFITTDIPERAIEVISEVY